MPTGTTAWEAQPAHMAHRPWTPPSPPTSRSLSEPDATPVRTPQPSYDASGLFCSLSDLTPEEWALVEATLPPRKPKTGRPGGDLRKMVNGILWVQYTGGPWRRMPSRYGRWCTIASRYHRWKQSGVWDRVSAVLRQRRHRRGALSLELDDSVVE